MKQAAVAVLVVVLVAAGCSGDDGGDDESTATTAAPSTTTTVPGPSPEERAAALCGARAAPGRTRVADPELAEISGAVSLPSGLWVHNDSGDEARVFRLDDGGRTQAVLRLEGVTATDWEDLAGVSADEGDELFLGDTGDNNGARPEVLVHRISVPDPVPIGEVVIPAADVHTITLTYPDGARDAEAVLVDPRTGDLVVVHKRYGGPSEVYVAAEDDWADGEATLVREGIVEVGDSAVDATTAADVSRGGEVVALRTYAAVLVFPREEDQSLAEALVENEACDAPTRLEVQGETVALTDDGYLTISEGQRPRINRFVEAGA